MSADRLSSAKTSFALLRLLFAKCCSVLLLLVKRCPLPDSHDGELCDKAVTFVPLILLVQF